MDTNLTVRNGPWKTYPILHPQVLGKVREEKKLPWVPKATIYSGSGNGGNGFGNSPSILNGREYVFDGLKLDLGANGTNVFVSLMNPFRCAQGEIVIPVNETDYKMTNKLSKLVGGFRGKRVLDIGFGVSNNLSEMQSQGATVHGIDPGWGKNKQDGHDSLGIPENNLISDYADMIPIYFKGKKFDLIFGRKTIEPDVMTDFDTREQRIKFFKMIFNHLTPGGVFYSKPAASGFMKADELREAGFNVLFFKGNGEFAAMRP